MNLVAQFKQTCVCDVDGEATSENQAFAGDGCVGAARKNAHLVWNRKYK